MSQPNIYVVGKAGAGKTTVAQHLVRNYGYTPSKFAHPVYMIAREYFGMQGKDRRLLQVIGTDAGRSLIDSDIWVSRMLQDLYIVEKTCEMICRPKPLFVSDDVRFPNEHKALAAAGWIGIYLDVPDEVRLTRLKGRDGRTQAETLGHASETSIDSFAGELLRIQSLGSMEDLYLAIDEFMTSIQQ